MPIYYWMLLRKNETKENSMIILYFFVFTLGGADKKDYFNTIILAKKTRMNSFSLDNNNRIQEHKHRYIIILYYIGSGYCR